MQLIKGNLGPKKGLRLNKNLGVLSSRLRKEVVLKMANLHVSLVARNIMVSFYCIPGVSMVVVRKDIR